MKVALTQSEGRLEGLAAVLAARGFEVVHQPLVETVPVPSEEARALLGCDWLLFTSRSAVEVWNALGLPLRGSARLGAVGEKTAETLERFGGEVALVGEPQNARGLADTFVRSVQPPATVGLPCGDRALETLEERLRTEGFKVHRAVVYETRARAWETDGADVVLLASPSAARVLPGEVGARAKLVALGPSTGAALAARGWRYTQAATPDAHAIAHAIERTL